MIGQERTKVFANRLKRSDFSLLGGVSNFLKQELHRPQWGQPVDANPFRPVNRPVFQTALASEENCFEAPPEPEPVIQTQYEHQHQRHDYAPHVIDAVIDDVPLAVRMLAMDWQRRQQKLVAQINAQQPAGCHVIALNIIPAELFAGELGRFLMMACDFYAQCFANTLLLPALSTGAKVLNLPQHPLVAADVQKSEARARLVQLRTRVANEHHRVASAIERGDVSALFKRNTNRPDYKKELGEICKSIAINTIGLSAFVTHESRFHDALREPQT
jgi:hypothetical protein